MTTPAEALKAVAKVLEERGEQNGPFEENFKNIAQVWTWWLKIRRGLAADLDASDVAALMALFKMARMLTGTLNRDDHYDNLGYGALLWGCMAEEIEATEKARHSTMGPVVESESAEDIFNAKLMQALRDQIDKHTPIVPRFETTSGGPWAPRALIDEYRKHAKKTGNFFNPDETQ